MKMTQRGGSTLSALVSAVLILGVLSWLLSDYLPASAEDLQAVVVLAGPSPAAKGALAALLKETPHPNRSELRDMRRRVNEVIVTEMARAITGDKTIEAPAERDAIRERQDVSRIAQLEVKSWGGMSNEERAHFLASKWLIALGVIGFMAGLLFALRAMQDAKRG